MPAWVEAGYQEYAQRLTTAPDLKLSLHEIPLQNRSNPKAITQLLTKESEALLAALSPKDHVVALDLRGKLWSTAQLSQRLTHWMEHTPSVKFLVGGPEGLSSACLARAQEQWSLSPLTFPHPLVRIMMAEQIYRAWSLLHHKPYHR